MDYKTSRHEGSNVEGFLVEKRKRCGAQVGAYAKALDGAKPGL